ncbi:MAG: hypothetical protein ACOYM2_20685 [Rectinemataceae bacterium]
MVAVRAKFTVESIEDKDDGAKSIRLRAVGDDGIEENIRFHKYTPSGTIDLWVNNPPAAEQFVKGKSFYIDFVPAE